MKEKSDFKTVTLTFNRGNQDIKNLLVYWTEKTGKSKVDILADALRQYSPENNISTNNNMNLDKDNFKILFKQVLKEDQDTFRTLFKEILIEPKEKNKQENLLNKLNTKKIKRDFLNDDD